MQAVVTISISFETEQQLQDALDDLEKLGYCPQVEYEEEVNPDEEELDELDFSEVEYEENGDLNDDEPYDDEEEEG